MSAKDDLIRLADVLSEYECQHLLAAVQAVAVGERFWEHDMAVAYNEYVKIRWTTQAIDAATALPVAPTPEAGLFVPIPIVKAYPGAERFSLPEPEPLDASLATALLRRRSRRDYADRPLSLRQLSTLLHHAGGTTGFLSGYGYDRLPLRSFPSSGALQAPEMYLAVHAVEGLPPGLFHYHPTDHALQALRPGSQVPALCRATFRQPQVEQAAVVVLVTGSYERLRWKYGERAYRYMCMEAGFLGENLHLAAEMLGLGACAVAGFSDTVLEELIDIDGEDEMALLLLTVGTL